MALQIFVANTDKPYLVDQGWGFQEYCCFAWREGRTRIRGYGMTAKEAIFDLKNNVQPDRTGELDGEGAFPIPVVGGNMFSPMRMVVE